MKFKILKIYFCFYILWKINLRADQKTFHINIENKLSLHKLNFTQQYLDLDLVPKIYSEYFMAALGNETIRNYFHLYIISFIPVKKTNSKLCLGEGGGTNYGFMDRVIIDVTSYNLVMYGPKSTFLYHYKICIKVKILLAFWLNLISNIKQKLSYKQTPVVINRKSNK